MFTPGDAENVPGLHAEHALTPLAFEKLPTSHLKQSLAFAAEKFPAAQGTHEVSTSIVMVRQAASETGSAASEVLGVAGALARHSNDLSGEVGAFLSDVKAA